MKNFIIVALLLIFAVSAFAFGSNCGSRNCNRDAKRNSTCVYSCDNSKAEDCPRIESEDK